MAIIDNIKQEIQQLDAGSFQCLCDAILSKEGYPNIVSLGTKAGSRKTTKGTPDTYFYTADEKYIFVEYTTQIDQLNKKISDDISKCLNESITNISVEKISEIIYCHTSSNITPEMDINFRKMCENVGVALTIIGIDKIAEDLYFKHRSLAKEYLNIPIGTGQIMEIDEFVTKYNSNKLAAPLDTQFLFREEEINCIDKTFATEDVVILYGRAGTGKTRLALHYAKLHADKNNEKLYCIRDNALPIYEDLPLYIDQPGKYFLFIDDANQLSGLKHVVEYVSKNSLGYEVKILISVRDYAVSKVKFDIRELTGYKDIEIKAFSDERIKEMLTTLLGIRNPDYLDRIVRISEGNARIAMLAGKIACESNTLSSINNISELYESYYGKALNDSGLVSNDKLLVVAGIISFLTGIHLDRIDSFLPILNAKGITYGEFTELTFQLHELEIVDICNDKAARFSEQCLSNFLLKYVFVDRKLILISDMIKVCFNTYKQRVISSINTLLSVYRDESIHDYLGNEIKKLWKELEEENSPFFFDFVATFSQVNPIETLLLLEQKINDEPNINVSIDDIDRNKGNNYQNVSNEIIGILCAFHDNEDLEAALDLFFQYYIKRPDLFIEFYHASKMYFSINKHSYNFGYNTQILFFKKLKEYSNGWKDRNLVILFLEIASSFLKLEFEFTESGRNNNIIFYNIPLFPSKGAYEYRGLIWDSLIELSVFDEYLPFINKIIESYGKSGDCSLKSIVEKDLERIKEIFNMSFPSNDINHCLLADALQRVYEIFDLENDPYYDGYLDNDMINIYRLLKGPKLFGKYSFDESAQIKKQQISEYISDCSSDEFRALIDICNEISDIHRNTYRIAEGLAIAFDILPEISDLYLDSVKYYLENNTPLNINPTMIINKLFKIMSVKDVFNLINQFNFVNKNLWLYTYYHEFPQRFISGEIIENIYDFLKDDSDKQIKSSAYRDLAFLKKYEAYDERVFLNCCKIILSKMEYSTFIVSIYFSLLFNEYYNSPKELVDRFKFDFTLLENIYIAMLSIEKYTDYDGKFLKEIYQNHPSILKKYVDFIVEDNNYSNWSDCEGKTIFFELPNYIEIYDYIIDELIKSSPYPLYKLEHFIKSIVIPRKGNNSLLEEQNNWINHFICTYSKDTVKMKALFSVISELKTERKIKYIKFFLENNDDYEMFKVIPLIPHFWSWSGSEIPLITSRIEFLEKVLPMLTGFKFVKHKKLVSDQIDYFYKRIEQVQIEEILEG